jgi:hypothetical protein
VNSTIVRNSGLGFLVLLASQCVPAPPVPPSSNQGKGPSHGLAVICSDYTSTAVALLNDNATEVLSPLLVHSGSATPGILTAFSGDVVLPTTAPEDGSIVLLDRYPNAVITRVDPVTGQVLRQTKVGVGFAANPHDVLMFDDGAMVITRFNANPQGGDTLDSNQGDDVVLLDHEGTLLSSLSMSLDGPVLGRPDRLLAVNDTLWISLNRISLDYQTYGSGGIARIRRTGDTLTMVDRIDLLEAKNCSAIIALGHHVAIGCSGQYKPSGDVYSTDASTILILDREGNEVTRLHASDPRVNQAFSPSLVAQNDHTLCAVTYGQPGDRVICWDINTDEVSTLYEANTPWSITAFAVANDGVLIVGDADPNAPRLCRLTDTITCVDACAATGLPPRVIGMFGSLTSQ